MSFQKFWKEHKVLVVMIPLVGLIHFGWYRIRSSPIFQIPKDNIREPDHLPLAIAPKDQIQEK
ncbi:uncharacterized protein [Dipodomys merriami]|uniref:uncharacterized protein n=1 Tax=Dipodomys merriami TaxID=94247 RepID=UPI003855FF04